MKITQLDIEGFRSLKKVSWKPGDLNVIIGPNGSGKSNLLRMLELISATVQGKLEEYINSANGIDQILWDGRSDDISFETTLSAPGIGDAWDGFIYSLNIERGPVINSYHIERELLVATDDRFRLIDKEGQSGTLSGRAKGQRIEVSSFDRESVFSSIEQPIVNWIRTAGFPYYNRALSKWTIYNDLRVDRQAPIRQPVVSKFEKRVAQDGQNLINVLHTLYTGDRDFKQQINSAMQAAFGEDFDELVFPPASDQRVQLRVRWKMLSREQSAADLSDGTLRFLFLLAVLASPSPAPLIAIDEPEAGLHPSMLPIIAEFAVDAAERTQVIFTTHSDQFLDAFTGTKPTTAVAKWENGETTLTTLSGEELDYWLKDYTLGSLFRSGELESLA